MDDDSCVLKYIEIVPLVKSEDSSNVTDVKGEPLSMKVSVVSSFYFIYLVYNPCIWNLFCLFGLKNGCLNTGLNSEGYVFISCNYHTF